MGYFMVNRVECRKNDSFGGIVYYDFNIGSSFESMDIVVFVFDDVFFDFVWFNVEYSYWVFNSCFCSYMLYRLYYDVFSFFICG